MKILLVLFFVLISIKASEDTFELESFSIMFENDATVKTDFSYTHGGRLSLLYFRGDTKDSLFNIPFTAYEQTSNYISLAYSNQMYTPSNIEKIYLVKNDRPYAGYSFIELGLHQASKNTLDSLTLELGMIGQATDMDALQRVIHNFIGTKKVCGWKYQLKDEYIFQLNYLHKDRFNYKNFYGYENDLISYYGVNLGNKSIKASGGALYRIGYNIINDFGVNSMNEANYASVPSKPKSSRNTKSDTSFFLNLSAGINLIARDIFLDGNTFKDSHSTNKKFFTAYIMAGLTYRYKQYKIDFFHNYYTEDYEQRDLYREYRGYSSLNFTYNF